ncbi:uncharacterized protein [Panulirus ornatus]|uniref:uncharacterized protein n=1 Tax=Panulirus ornatus TaxID=150431 RepID=UPI003A8B9E5C
MVRRRELGNGRLVAQPLYKSHLYTITASNLPPTPRLPEEFRLGTIQDHHVEHMHKHWKFRETRSVDAYRRMLHTVPAVGVFTTTTAPATTTTADETVLDKAKKNTNVGTTMEDTLGYTVISKKGLSNTLETNVKESDAHGETMISGGDEVGRFDTSDLPVAWTSFSYRNCINHTYTLKEYRRRGLGRAVTVALATRVLHDDDRVSALVICDNDTAIKFHEQLGFTRECDLGWQRYSVL